MTDRQLRDEAVTLFMAGHETTANTLAWVWYLLSLHPEVEARLHAELDAVLPDRPPEVCRPPPADLRRRRRHRDPSPLPDGLAAGPRGDRTGRGRRLQGPEA